MLGLLCVLLSPGELTNPFCFMSPQVEATQAMIRIVGLSATLPNYTDVAHFLKVRRAIQRL